jgi:hypothetical protein
MILREILDSLVYLLGPYSPAKSYEDKLEVLFKWLDSHFHWEIKCRDFPIVFHANNSNIMLQK